MMSSCVSLLREVTTQEVQAIKNIKFNSEPALANYLGDSKAAYDSVVGLLVAGGELVCKFQNDNTRAPIAHDIFSYIVYCANNAFQTVPNYTLRMNYQNKISEHAKTLIMALQELDPENVTNVARLAEDGSKQDPIRIMVQVPRSVVPIRSGSVKEINKRIDMNKD